MSKDTTISYQHPRPYLVIESAGGRNLGRCYNESRWKITSTSPLTLGKVQAILQAAGLQGNAGTDINGGDVPAGEDQMIPVERDIKTGEVTKIPHGRLTMPSVHGHRSPYYVSDVAIRIDSGD